VKYILTITYIKITKSNVFSPYRIIIREYIHHPNAYKTTYKVVVSSYMFTTILYIVLHTNTSRNPYILLDYDPVTIETFCSLLLQNK